MKYIMFEVKGGTLEMRVPVIFPDNMVHKVIADAVEPAVKAHFPKFAVELVSAGTVSSLDLSMVSGGSTTLELSSTKLDGEIMSLYDYTAGVM